MRTVEQVQSIYNDLTTSEVGRRVGNVTGATVREWIEAGLVPEAINVSPHRTRREWRIPEAAVERMRRDFSAGELQKRAG
ncbi:MAG TPA: hypothetical protein VFI96_09370 [Longimicrobiaceae bacterium]|nr:hypothetical protein [Longimicrobiaceae bacterium]